MVTVTELNRAPDGTFESLEANTLIGADVANAPENQILVTQGDGTLAAETQAQGPNPYDQSQTFAESDVTITNNKTAVTNGSIKLFELDTISDFEDGNITTVSNDWDGWTNDTAQLDAQQNVVINGSFSGELTSTNGLKSVSTTRDTTTTNNIKLTIQIGTNTGNTGDDIFLILRNRNGNAQIGRFEWIDGGAVEWEGNQVLSSWSAGTSYNIEFDWDFGSDALDIIINGANEGTFSFRQSSSAIDDIEIQNDTNGSGTSRELYIDDVGEVTSPTSGDATIEWDRGIPTDIFEWDVATFTRTLDNETVDVFVAYSSDGGSTWTRTNSGNPITRNYSLNADSNITADEDVRIEAELSRANTANNPTLDSAYRSWLV